jgi:ribonucleotide reductase beta subunit family protein with ferritin-like domain
MTGAHSATAASRPRERRAVAAERLSYSDLYARWEAAHWSPLDIDLTEDRAQWRKTMTDFERRAALWNYAMFLHGEDAVSATLAPYIEAAPREEQRYFLATQQVDEARHSLFFARFMREVVHCGSTVGSSLDATRPELTWGFRKTFNHLEKVADGLRKDRSLPNFAAAITMYHLLVEASLAQPGQEFIASYLDARDLMPGLREGLRNIARDEQRHIGFGVKCLSDLVSQEPLCRHAVADLMREVMPFMTAVFVPPGWDRRYTEVFGATLEDVFERGVVSLESKLRAAGLPPEDLPGAPPIPYQLPPRERAERLVTVLEANYLGQKVGSPSRDPRAVAALFDILHRSLDTSAAPHGYATIQWDFRDLDPWFVRIVDGTAHASPGRSDAADIVLRCRFEDWIDIVARRIDPRIALITGKLRLSGRPSMLWRMTRLFGT